MYVLIVSGLSGAGKSVAIKACEDLGFYCVDNLPTALIPTFADLLMQSQTEHVALGIDVREGAFLDGLMDALDTLEGGGHQVEILFLDAKDDVLVRRYSETRRKHPLATDGSVLDGIAKEREFLQGLQQRATRVLETTDLNVHELRALMQESYRIEARNGRMEISVQSFGFKYGVPMNTDLVFDVRFLPNPHFDPELRPGTGKDVRVAQYALGNATGQNFLHHLQEFLLVLMPLYEQEGKAYLTISIGCTGGRHRSVATVEAISRYLGQQGYEVTPQHRDIAKAT